MGFECCKSEQILVIGGHLHTDLLQLHLGQTDVDNMTKCENYKLCRLYYDISCRWLTIIMFDGSTRWRRDECYSTRTLFGEIISKQPVDVCMHVSVGECACVC